MTYLNLSEFASFIGAYRFRNALLLAHLLCGVTFVSKLEHVRHGLSDEWLNAAELLLVTEKAVNSCQPTILDMHIGQFLLITSSTGFDESESFFFVVRLRLVSDRHAQVFS